MAEQTNEGVVQFVNRLFFALSRLSGKRKDRAGQRHTVLPITPKGFQRILHARFPDRYDGENEGTASGGGQKLSTYCSYFNNGLHKMGYGRPAMNEERICPGDVDLVTSEHAVQLLGEHEVGAGTPAAMATPPFVAPSGFDELADRLLLDVSFFREVDQLLAGKGQVIFYGPPGTGKTFVARELARHFAGQNGKVEIIQFHPSYTYEDFVEGFRPVLRDGQPGFELVRGPLRRLARMSRQDPDSTFVLLIDEINRGNVAKIFGELYFLLECRNEGIRLQYNRKYKFSMPDNLWIIGTMNTADRSIALIDAALRRRFFFVPFFPDTPPVAGVLKRWLNRNKPQLTWVADVVDEANRRLGSRHSALGPSHVLRHDLDDSWVERIWKHSILPFLAEQFFGEEERLDEFGLDLLKKAVKQSTQEDASDAAVDAKGI